MSEAFVVCLLSRLHHRHNASYEFRNLQGCPMFRDFLYIYVKEIRGGGQLRHTPRLTKHYYVVTSVLRKILAFCYQFKFFFKLDIF